MSRFSADTSPPRTVKGFVLALFCALTLAAVPLPAAAAKGVGGIGADGVEVEINKGTIVRLPGVASVVAVANPAVADVEVMSPGLISVQGRGVGQTTVVALNAQGDEILNETVTVTHNLSRLRMLASNVLPGSRIDFRSVDGALVMSGDVESPLEADNIRRVVEPFLAGGTLVNMLNIKGSDQVMLQVRVAEVSRTELKRFGVNLGAVLTSGDFTFGLFNGRSLLPALRADTNGTLSAQFTDGSTSLDSVLDALAEDNLIKLLAEPNLTTTSGRSANFLAGGEFPIPVPGEDGRVTIEFRQYGISLRFTPVVLTRERISLTVAPEVSELSQLGAVDIDTFNIPALTTRRAETTVELGSGQSFAIAGLLQHDNSNNVEKFPGLGDLPVIGALFRSNEFRSEQTELMILVTPYIVRGVAAKQLTDPTKGYVPPSDPARIVDGKHYMPTPEKPLPLPLPSGYETPSPSTLRKPDARQSAARNLSPRQARNRTGQSDGGATVTQADPLPSPQPERPAPVEEAPAILHGPVGYRLE